MRLGIPARGSTGILGNSVNLVFLALSVHPWVGNFYASKADDRFYLFPSAGNEPVSGNPSKSNNWLCSSVLLNAVAQSS